MTSTISLMYHCVYSEDRAESGFQNKSAFQYKLSVWDFEEQVRTICNYCDFKKLNKNLIEFTFDDGGVSFYTVIAPILEKYNLRGVFCISTKYINTPLFLTDSQILELHKRGHIIASHTHSHPVNLANLNEKAIFDEWVESKQYLENIIGSEVLIASIPNGYGGETVNRQANKAGYRTLYTSKPTVKIVESLGIKVLGRYVIHDSMSTDYVLSIITNSFLRKKLYFRWQILNILKFLLGDFYSKLKNKIAK